MSEWNISVSNSGEQPYSLAIASMDDDRDVYRYLLCILLDLQERHENPIIFVNEKRFRPKEEDVADYQQYLADMVEHKKVTKPIVSVACMRRYATDIVEHDRELREQAEQIVESVHRPVNRMKVKVR